MTDAARLAVVQWRNLRLLQRGKKKGNSLSAQLSSTKCVKLKEKKTKKKMFIVRDPTPKCRVSLSKRKSIFAQLPAYETY